MRVKVFGKILSDHAVTVQCVVPYMVPVGSFDVTIHDEPARERRKDRKRPAAGVIRFAEGRSAQLSGGRVGCADHVFVLHRPEQPNRDGR